MFLYIIYIRSDTLFDVRFIPIVQRKFSCKRLSKKTQNAEKI